MANDHGARHIRGGRKRPRDLLFMAATSAARFNADLVFERLKTASKAHKVAIVAVMRNVLANTLLQQQRCWSPEAPVSERRRPPHGPHPCLETAPLSGTPQISAVHHGKPRRSRAQRWRDAVAELGALQEHYRDCLDSLPDSLRDTAYGERLQIIVEADIEILEEIEPPRGYGRDT